ncbi:PadR family transcriptional regulator [Micromonospora zhanjiangensis]|uniref:PadR family transcriptional regulator n=1 Tax=Micromonospora zhanjiangensis TaxID=1522057 RepID=A0ABV8KLL9_9ACTN
MTAVFSHGRLRLYLLKLLDDGPKHGYELIRLLEHRFHGTYAPSAGTVYPRLQRMETEGLVAHTRVGGRKVYEITAAGRDELHRRAAELAELEIDISASVADLASLAGQIRSGVRDSVRDLRRELREAARETRRNGWGMSTEAASPGPAAPVDLSTEFEDRLAAFVTEVRARASHSHASERQLRAAIRVLDGALDALRRLLR